VTIYFIIMLLESSLS